jgi:(p)ppGpp synthase/HD superfamily hydrolase
MIEKSKVYAIKCHRDRNQKYCNDLPYEYHLQSAVNIGINFIKISGIPEEDRDDVIAGIWCHDVIEDTGQTYNDVKRATNEDVAEYAYALTNEKGRTRKDRANDAYYKGIRYYKHATFIKLCDRLANVKFSKDQTDKKMFDMYKKEHKEFKNWLYDGRFEPMWFTLTCLFFEKEV